MARSSARSVPVGWGMWSTLAVVGSLVGVHLALVVLARAVGRLPAAVRLLGLPGYHLVHGFAAVGTALVGHLPGPGFWVAFVLFYGLHGVAADALVRVASSFGLGSPEREPTRAGYGLAATLLVLGTSVGVTTLLVARGVLPDPRLV